MTSSLCPTARRRVPPNAAPRPFSRWPPASPFGVFPEFSALLVHKNSHGCCQRHCRPPVERKNMLALLTDRKSGEVSTYEVPAPELRPGGILVRTHCSAISAGTERATLALSSKSLLAKAKARPDLVKQVVDYARQNGLKAALQKVHSKLDTLTTLGYSCAGEVTAVGEGVNDFRPGDRVACGGGGFANHAEVNFVPRNLAVLVPPEVSSAAASLTTIGAIAMQGV